MQHCLGTHSSFSRTAFLTLSVLFLVWSPTRDASFPIRLSAGPSSRILLFCVGLHARCYLRSFFTFLLVLQFKLADDQAMSGATAVAAAPSTTDSTGPVDEATISPASCAQAQPSSEDANGDKLVVRNLPDHISRDRAMEFFGQVRAFCW